MQLSLLKALFVAGTLAGVAFAHGGSYGKHGYKYKGNGVVKRIILIDGCTGMPVTEKPKVPEIPAPEDDGYSTSYPPIRPNIPNASQRPTLPNVPNLPNLPNIPNLPNLPNIPNLPNLPNIPNLPDLPDISQLEQYAPQIQELGRQLGLPV